MITSISVTNISEAKTAILMLQAYLSVHGEAELPTPEVKAETPKAEPKPKAEKKVPATRAKDAVKKDAPKAKAEPEAKAEPTPEAEPIDLTGLAKAAIGRTDRDTVKDVIASFGTGKISSVPEDKIPELAEALKAL